MLELGPRQKISKLEALSFRKEALEYDKIANICFLAVELFHSRASSLYNGDNPTDLTLLSRIKISIWKVPDNNN